MIKKEREICEFEMIFNNCAFALLKARPENGYGFYRVILKTSVDNFTFCQSSEIGSGFEGPDGTPPPRFPRSTPLGS